MITAIVIISIIISVAFVAVSWFIGRHMGDSEEAFEGGEEADEETEEEPLIDEGSYVENEQAVSVPAVDEGDAERLGRANAEFKEAVSTRLDRFYEILDKVTLSVMERHAIDVGLGEESEAVKLSRHAGPKAATDVQEAMEQIIARIDGLETLTRGLITASKPRCLACDKSVSGNDEIFFCPRCRGAYHQRCWDENGGCTTFGCVVVNRVDATI